MLDEYEQKNNKINLINIRKLMIIKKKNYYQLFSIYLLIEK
jgi:hypothetical protein